MRPESRRVIHIGINFWVSPAPDINARKGLEIQDALLMRGVEYDSFEALSDGIHLVRGNPMLDVRIKVDPGQPFGQVLVLAPQPNRPVDVFREEAQEVIRAFEQVWPCSPRQVVRSDATLRELYETTDGGHAFRELWEGQLGQQPQSLAALERQVLGGGIRLVMPPAPTDPDPVAVELKIESYLRDTTKLYVETQFVWEQPVVVESGDCFGSSAKLQRINQYAENQVRNYLVGRRT